MKKFFPTLVFALVLLAGIVALILTFQLAGQYSKKTEEAAECHITGKDHRIIFQNDQIKPKNIHTNLCDKLTIINEDSKLRLVAFGEHDEHKSYDGVSEKVLSRGQSLRLTMIRAGEFKFHDHFNEDLEAVFTVTE